uniref:protein sel-1 homolog 3-like n=1 Tax=Styela clava TaxID=7725 RepID=UPI00193ACF81|nr:protein sel-1 homolog 3-like [Styela clava]
MIMSIKCCSSLLLFILGFGEAISQWGGIPLTQRIQSDNNRVLQYHQEQMRLAGINHPGSVLAENRAIPVAPLQYRDFVTIENTPNKVKANHTLNIKYQCSQPFTIVLFMDGNYLQLNKPNINKSISIYKDSDIIFFRKFWQCERSPRESKVQIPLIFPPELLRPPNLMLQKVWTMQSVNLKIAMVDKALWTYLENAEYLLRDTCHIAFEKSHKSMVLPLKFEHPYCRSEDEFGRCFHWPYAMINEVFLKQPPKSPHDSVVTHLLKHPIVSSETHVGIPRNFYRFMNSEMRQRNKYKEPRYTFSMVFYLASACEKLCAVLQHIGDDGHYTTPIVFINDKSQIHVQGQVADNQSYAFYSDWTVPLNEWVRLDIQQYSVMLNVTMKHGKNFTETSSVMKSFHLPMIQDYESGFFTVGSSMYARNFRGIIGSATLWRSMVLTSEEIPVPTPDEAMFQLGIEDMLMKSKKVMTMINQRWEFLLSQKINETRKANSDICLPYFLEIIRPVKEKSLEKCPLESEPLPKSLSRIEAELVKLSKKRRKASINVQLELGERLYNKALRLIDGIDTIMKMNSIIKVLENAAMLNHGEACSLLYVIYANGFGTNIDNEKARKYLHLGGMLGDRISIKILAHKHLNGEDDFKKDEEIAFYYYYNAAQAAQTDRQQHVESMTDVNRVRLTDEKRLKHQTSEDEDLFQWLKHQAGTGMKEAKQQDFMNTLYIILPIPEELGTAALLGRTQHVQDNKMWQICGYNVLDLLS